MANVEQELREFIIPDAQARINAAVGGGVTLEVDWASFSTSANPARALQSLYSFNSYFVFERVASCIERLCREGGPEQLRGKLRKIIVSNLKDEERETLNEVAFMDGTLVLRGRYHKGAFSGFSRIKLRRALERMTNYRAAASRKEWDSDSIVDFNKRMKDELKFTIPIEVDWDSFEKGGNDDALRNLVYWHGWYSLYPLYWALRRIAQRSSEPAFSGEDIKNNLKKIVFKNVAGSDYTKKYCYLSQDGVLHYNGVFEEGWSGVYGEWQLEQIISNQMYLNSRLKPFMNQNPEAQKQKIEFLREAATDQNICNGHWDFIRQIGAHNGLRQPSEAEKEAMIQCLQDFNAAPDAERKKGDQIGKEAATPEGTPSHEETFINGWRVKKINYRGQEQTRLAVLTEKAFYTFKYSFGKKKCDVKHSHRFQHDEYYWSNVSELKAPSGGGALGAVAAVAAALSDKRFGFRYITSRSNKSGGLLGAAADAAKAAIAKKVWGIMRTMIEKQIATRDDLPEIKLPKMPSWTIASLIDIINNDDNLGAMDKIPTVSFSNGTSAGLGDALSLIAEQADDLARQPPIKLANAPTISVGFVLLKLIDILEGLGNVQLDLPDSPHLGGFMKQIIKIIKKMQDSIPAFSLPDPEPMAIVDILQSMKTGLMADAEIAKAIQPFELPRFPPMPAVPQLIDEICEQVKSAGVPAIKFPGWPEFKLLDTLEKVADALSSVNLPTFELPKLDLPSIPMPELPAFVKMLKGPPEPDNAELTLEPFIEGSDLQETVCKEMCWLLYGCVRAYTRPYYQWQPYTTSHTLPQGGPMVTIYNKAAMGKDDMPAAAPSS